jgi:hypothetical protein
VSKARVAVLLVGVALLAVSCSDDDSGESADTTSATAAPEVELPADAQPFVDAVVEDAMNPDEPTDIALPEDEARCLGERAVAIVGMDAIDESGATPEEFAEAEQLIDVDIELSDTQVDEFEAAFRTCISAATLEESFTAAFGSPGSDACAGAFDSDAFYRSSALSLRADDEAAEQAIGDWFAEIPDACAELALLSGVGESLAVDRDCLAEELDDAVSHETLIASVEHGNNWTTAEPELAATLEAAVTACQTQAS